MKAKFSYVGIRVRDLDESIKFYTSVLGMKLLGRSEIATTKGIVASLQSEGGDFSLELNYYRKGSPYASRYSVGDGLDHLAFQVEDLTKALVEATEAGYPTLIDIKTAKSRWAYIQDPNGIQIELFT